MKNDLNQKVAQLKNKLNGQVLLREDADYHAVRQIWNAMIDRYPAVIVRCADSRDVQSAILFAEENGMELSIRGAGHNIAGTALVDNGLMVDLSAMKSVKVDPVKKRAYVDPGATLHDFDEAAQAHGLATPLGINSTTGVAGLTLGGGFGWLTRKYGLTIDNLISAEVITAGAEKLTASEDVNPELFWAIRGGGGNFGIVTRFEFQLHPVGPEILAGVIVFPFDQALQVLSKYQEFVQSAPEELNVWAVLRQAPPLPFLPQEVHGKEVVILPVFYGGDLAKGQKVIEPLRAFGTPHGEHIGVQPYSQWQQTFDPLLTPGARNYWKSLNFTELGSGTLHTLKAFAGKLPSPQSEIFVALISGAINRVPSNAMAYADRDTKFIVNVHARWENAADDGKCIAWAREFFRSALPFASAGGYVNFMTEEEGDRVASVYGSNYSRLAQIKSKYDPNNVFHRNQNIKPGA